MYKMHKFLRFKLCNVLDIKNSVRFGMTRSKAHRQNFFYLNQGVFARLFFQKIFLATGGSFSGFLCEFSENLCGQGNFSTKSCFNFNKRYLSLLLHQ